jgi:predicted NAD/FAD-dependent oxidoreductase
MEVLENPKDNYIATKGIAAIPHFLSKGLKIKNAAVKSIERTKEGWYVNAVPYKQE